MVKLAVDERQIADIVARVLASLETGSAGTSRSPRGGGDEGVFADLDEAVRAAKTAQRQLAALPLAGRSAIVEALRRTSIEHVEEIARLAHEETGYGRVPDKIRKKLLAARLTPGVEDIQVEAKSGDGGLVLIERAPFGLIASIEPSTHPGACVINHAVSMVAAGNAVVFLPHPKGIRTAQALIRLYSRAVQEAGGPENLLVVGDSVSMENFDLVLNHPLVDMVVATGGPEVVDRALRSGKKAIAAGPGNPPVVVDETADLDQAARCIVEGASFDNTVLCIAEKVIIVVEAVAEELRRQLAAHGAWLADDPGDGDRILAAVIPGGRVNPALIGKDPAVILDRAGVAVSGEPRLIVLELSAGHPLVEEEQMLPVLPLVRVADFAGALDLAARVEHGFKHTAMIHSRDVGRITAYARRLSVDIMVANAPSSAGLGVGAEGHYSHTIASPTGEGICTPRTYTREQRTVIAGALRTA